ncbi:MAG: aromatic ring-hydroxylating dioxygenase subunit alpha [Polyangiaceae bacterium]|nr:aromatic ring-hydroxylating dioxygenase subunit alpha [Polyangiaceae bacterium]
MTQPTRALPLSPGDSPAIGGPLGPYPRGWFLVRFSDELAPGVAVPIRYFGEDLVLFRGESGAVKILDAFCPHLGAHLGHGGKVEGDQIRCPFHAWRFDGDGVCTDVPYASRIPPRARVACWPVVERDGMIFVWHDPEHGPPDWELPSLASLLEEGRFTAWSHSVLEIKTHPREIVENLVDTAHFMPVHGTRADKFRNEYLGHVAVQHNSGVAYPLGGGEDAYDLTATYYGPAYMVTHMRGVRESLIINAHTPIGPNLLHLRFAVALRQQGDREISPEFTARYIDNLRRGYQQDVEIWEHKVFRERPLLSECDGEFGNLRRWYRAFYEPRASKGAAE